MPTYTYQCKRCESLVEVYHAMSASPKIRCESCGGPTKRMLGSGAGIIFKGSGFYETDYKRSNGGADGKSAKDNGGDGGAKTESSQSAKDTASAADSGGGAKSGKGAEAQAS